MPLSNAGATGRNARTLLSRPDTARDLHQSVLENRESRWWTRKQYAERYPIGESDKALGSLFEVFDVDWLKEVLDGWMNGRKLPHPLVKHLVPKGLYPLVILVELGKDLQEVKVLKNFDHIVKELRDPSKFIAAWLELELAAHCVRMGYSLELYPQIRGKRPDLKLCFNEEDVLVEIKEIHPSDVEQRCLETSLILLPQVQPVLRRGASVEMILDALPNESQMRLPQKKISELLAGPGNQLVQIGSLRVWVRVEEKGTGSFCVVPSRKMAKSELRRLGRSIKHEAEQIPTSHSGLIILDAETLQGHADEEVTRAVKKAFLKYRLPNIIGTTIVRSYKFYKPEKESEVIMISNPNYKGDMSIRKLNRILSFSRTRELIPQKQPPQWRMPQKTSSESNRLSHSYALSYERSSNLPDAH
jgi:hypothetical protein